MRTKTKSARKTKGATAKPHLANEARGSSDQAAAHLSKRVSQPAKATKRDQLAALLIRDEGATIEQMIAATGWLPHTVRAALTGLKKLGYAIDSDKIDGLRTYRAVAPR